MRQAHRCAREGGEASILETPRLEAIVGGAAGKRLAEQAFEALHAAIQDGRLVPGQRIPELELCGRLGVSRTPVREALRRLQADGLVVPAPGGGLAVAQLDVRALAELYELRESLEGTAAALAARHAEATEIGILEAVLAAQRALPADPALHARENKVFHGHIYRAAHNRFLLKCLDGLHDAVALLGSTTFVAAGRIGEAWAEHAAIVAAIGARDAARAEALAREHVRRAFGIRQQHLAAAAQAGLRERAAPPG